MFNLVYFSIMIVISNVQHIFLKDSDGAVVTWLTAAVTGIYFILTDIKK